VLFELLCTFKIRDLLSTTMGKRSAKHSASNNPWPPVSGCRPSLSGASSSSPADNRSAQSIQTRVQELLGRIDMNLFRDISLRNRQEAEQDVKELTRTVSELRKKVLEDYELRSNRGIAADGMVQSEGERLANVETTLGILMEMNNFKAASQFCNNSSTSLRDIERLDRLTYLETVLEIVLRCPTINRGAVEWQRHQQSRENKTEEMMIRLSSLMAQMTAMSAEVQSHYVKCDEKLKEMEDADSSFWNMSQILANNFRLASRELDQSGESATELREHLHTLRDEMLAVRNELQDQEASFGCFESLKLTTQQLVSSHQSIALKVRVVSGQIGFLTSVDQTASSHLARLSERMTRSEIDIARLSAALQHPSSINNMGSHDIIRESQCQSCQTANSIKLPLFQRGRCLGSADDDDDYANRCGHLFGRAEKIRSGVAISLSAPRGGSVQDATDMLHESAKLKRQARSLSRTRR
jgi:hypothetical protein